MNYFTPKTAPAPALATAPDALRLAFTAHQQARKQTSLPMWTVYERPSDWPREYVVRLHLNHPRGARATTVAFRGPTLDSVRAVIPSGLVKVLRNLADDPKIVEVWL